MASFPRPDRSRLSIAAANLKRCPLCGAVNAQQNHECFACGWRGRFDVDPEVVEEGLNLLIERCPELANTAQAKRPRLSFWQRVRSLFRRRLDVRT